VVPLMPYNDAMARKRAADEHAGSPSDTTAGGAQGELEIPIRVTVVDPPPGVQFCIQGRGKELVGQVRSVGEDLSFDVVIRAAHAGENALPRFLGLFTHGPPAGRFLYVCAGTCAGQAESRWTRRAKIPLSGITLQLIEQLRKTGSARLEARIKGTAKDGGPVCATVGLLNEGWKAIR
jgi:Family of unknown function (DUF5990)